LREGKRILTGRGEEPTKRRPGGEAFWAAPENNSSLRRYTGGKIKIIGEGTRSKEGETVCLGMPTPNQEEGGFSVSGEDK